MSLDPKDALRQIQHDLAGVTLGFEAAREAAASQMDKIFTDRFTARRVAGASPTYLCQAPPVARVNVESAIADWWAGGRTVLALLGDEGTGKTWAALAAMRKCGTINGGPLTVVIPSSTAAKATDGMAAVAGALSEIAKDANWSTKDPMDFWRRRLLLWSQGRSEGPQPFLLVLVDGLDELDPFDWDRWLAPLLESSMAGLVRIIVACRRDDWQRWAKLHDLDMDQLQEFPVPQFQPAERDAFLQSQGIDVSQVSTQVLEAALHPRTAFHLTRLGTDIGDIKRITRELILLRDYRNRYDLKRGPLDPEAFEKIVIMMARKAEAAAIAQEAFHASAGDLIGHAVEITGHEPKTMRRVLSELISGGWVQRAPGSPHDLTFTDKALPLAIGMALANDIQSKKLEEAIADVDRLLEPWEADDIIEPVLRTCATVLITQDAPDALCRNILQRWGNLRFHDLAAQDFWRRIQVFKPNIFLYLVESNAIRADWLGEWGLASLWEDQPKCVAMVEASLQRWLTQIGLPQHHAHADAKLELHLNRERHRQLRRLKALERVGETGWLDLLGTEIKPRGAPFYRAVRTIGFLPRASFAPGLTAWAIAAAVSGRRYGFREIAILLRDNPFDWEAAIEAVTNAANALIGFNTGLSRSAAALLLEATGRPEDAVRAAELLPRSAGRKPKPLLIAENGQLVFGPEAPCDHRTLIANLVDFAANPDLNLSSTVHAEFDQIVSKLHPKDISEWLQQQSPKIAPLLRWARAKTLEKIEAFVDEGLIKENNSTYRSNFARIVLKIFPVLSLSEVSKIADHANSKEIDHSCPAITALRMLPSSFSNHLEILATKPQATWPDRVEYLLREPDSTEYIQQIGALDFAEPTEVLRNKLNLISKIIDRIPNIKVENFEWSKAFIHPDMEIKWTCPEKVESDVLNVR